MQNKDDTFSHLKDVDPNKNDMQDITELGFKIEAERKIVCMRER